MNNKKPPFGGFYCSISNSSDSKISSSKNSVSEISNPFAIMITVLRVTVLFRPFIIHCMLPCCIPVFCSRRYWDIFFSRSSAEMRFATALFTVNWIPPSIRRFNSVSLPTYDILTKILKNIKKVCLHTIDFWKKECYTLCRYTYIWMLSRRLLAVKFISLYGRMGEI